MKNKNKIKELRNDITEKLLKAIQEDLITNPENAKVWAASLAPKLFPQTGEAKKGEVEEKKEELITEAEFEKIVNNYVNKSGQEKTDIEESVS